MQPLLAGSKCQCTWMTKKGEVLLITSNLSVAMQQSRMTRGGLLDTPVVNTKHQSYRFMGYSSTAMTDSFSVIYSYQI